MLQDPVNALDGALEGFQEMGRVTIKAGMVAAKERGSLNCAFIPGDEKLTKIALRLRGTPGPTGLRNWKENNSTSVRGCQPSFTKEA